MMLTSHRTIQGYNGQALVDAKHQIIVHVVDYEANMLKAKLWDKNIDTRRQKMQR